MKKVLFTATKEEPYAEFNTDLNEYVIDLTNHGYALAPNGLNLGNVKPKRKYIELEGANGRIDVTNALTDDIKYDNREPSITFRNIEMNSFEHVTNERVMNRIFNGSNRKLIIDDWYMEGAFMLESSISMPFGKYEIIGDVYPYCMNLSESSVTFEVTDTLETSIEYDDSMIVCPVINVSAEMEMTLYGAVYSLKQGDNIVPDLILSNGSNALSLTGTGTAVFTWRGGNL